MEQLEQLIVGSRRLVGAELKQRVLRAASGFAALGVSAGNRIAILMRNDLPQIEVSLAAQHLGAYPVQMNWHGQTDELAYVLADCGAHVLVTHADLLTRLEDASGSRVVVGVLPSPDVVSAYRIPQQALQLPAGVPEWESWLAHHEPTRVPARPGPESIIYTSGTTGRPKGVCRFKPTAEQVAQTEHMRHTVFGIGSGARVLVPAPLYHAAPNSFAMRAVRHARTLVLSPRFDAADLLADIERYRITHVYAVPTIFVRLLNIPLAERSRHDVSSLVFVLHAGGPCPPSVKQAMLDWWGPIVHEFYGSTEAGPITFCRGDESLARPGSVGRPVEGVHIEIHDDEGRPLGVRQVGELCVRNDCYADFTYLNQPDARADLQRGDLIATGDMGFYDEDGYYFLCDRKRDLVISGGVNIYPAEIETVLHAMEGVADCAVFGIPDEEFGESLAALVQPHVGYSLEPAVVRKFLSARLARFKVPRLIEIRAQLPRDDSGKIKKRLLREPYWSGTGRSI